MKRLLHLSALALLFCAISTTAQTQDSTAITLKFYPGLIYFSHAPNLYSIENEIEGRLGTEIKVQLPLGLLTARAVIHAVESSNTTTGHIFYTAGTSNPASLSIGRLPRPTAQILKPHPVSADGQLEHPALAIIPGAAVGALGKLKINAGENATHSLYFGCYSNERRPEWNAATQTSDSFWGLIGLQAYWTPTHNNEKLHYGIGGNWEKGPFSLKIFKQTKETEDVRSLFSMWVIGNKSIFVGLLRQKRQISMLDLGGDILLKKPTSLCLANIRIGLALRYSESAGNEVYSYVQVWGE